MAATPKTIMTIIDPVTYRRTLPQRCKQAVAGESLGFIDDYLTRPAA